MNFKICEYKNQVLIKEYNYFADSEIQMIAFLAPDKRFQNGNEIVKRLKLKDTDIDVFISIDGVFFFFTPNGDEAILEDLSFDWMMEPVGAYYSEMLKKLDVETLVFNQL